VQPASSAKPNFRHFRVLSILVRFLDVDFGLEAPADASGALVDLGEHRLEPMFCIRKGDARPVAFHNFVKKFY
jgi:hypothetical protein